MSINSLKKETENEKRQFYFSVWKWFAVLWIQQEIEEVERVNDQLLPLYAFEWSIILRIRFRNYVVSFSVLLVRPVQPK